MYTTNNPSNKKKVSSSIHLRLPAQILETFNEITDKLNTSRNEVLLDLLKEWLEDQEDIMCAEKVMQDIKDGKTEVVSWSEMERMLDKE